MHRQLISFTIALSLSTIGCRQPCAGFQSCLAINIKFSKPELAEGILDCKVIALNKNCAIVREYRPKQSVPYQPSQIIEIPTKLPDHAEWLRIVAKTKPGATRWRPATWRINDDGTVREIEAEFSPLLGLSMPAPEGQLDASQHIQYIPKTKTVGREEPLLLVRGAMLVQPVFWDQKNPESGLLSRVAADDLNCKESVPPLHVSFSPTSPYYSILYQESPDRKILHCQINAKKVSSYGSYNVGSKLEWHDHTDLVLNGKHDCTSVGYDGPSGPLRWVGCESAGRLPDLFSSAKTDMYTDLDGTIKNYIYYNKGNKVELSQLDLSVPETPILKPTLTTEMAWSADVLVKLADLNNDQYIDVVSANKETKEIIWFLGSAADISLKDKLHWPTEIMKKPSLTLEPEVGKIKNIALGDVDGDMTPDLVIAFDRKATVYWGNGNGSGFNKDEKFDIPSASDVATLAVGDLDGDCAAEIAMGTPNTLRIANVPSTTIGIGR